MRTPVAAIEGYLALALNENVSKIDPKARSFLEKAHSSTQHLGQLSRPSNKRQNRRRPPNKPPSSSWAGRINRETGR